MLKTNLANMVGNDVVLSFDQPFAASPIDTGIEIDYQPLVLADYDDELPESIIPRRAVSNDNSDVSVKSEKHLAKKSLKVMAYVSIGLFSIIGFVFTGVFVGMQFGLFNVKGSITDRNSFYSNLTKITPPTSKVAAAVTTNSDNCTQIPANCIWEQSPQWATVSAGLTNDSAEINQAASQTGVSSRMIISAVAPEQLRLFTSERETYERYFQPLKILGSMTDFSLGISGTKQQTARQVEINASNPSSPFYPGPAYANLISYPNGKYSSSILYSRLTSKNHYYDYLYTGLFIKELEAQWLRSGYDISQRPDVVTTLYNLGLDHSVPKANPQAGGTAITLNNQTYSFGQLGTLIYNSDQLTNIFSLPISNSTP